MGHSKLGFLSMYRIVQAPDQSEAGNLASCTCWLVCRTAYMVYCGAFHRLQTKQRPWWLRWLPLTTNSSAAAPGAPRLPRSWGWKHTYAGLGCGVNPAGALPWLHANGLSCVVSRVYVVTLSDLDLLASRAACFEPSSRGCWGIHSCSGCMCTMW
jgi:hypothetical protein